MVTMVGTQSKLNDAIQDLIELEYDALEAYEAAIEKLDSKEYREKLKEFCGDHQRHINELSKLAKTHGVSPPEGPSAKQWLTKGKVYLSNLFGDTAILNAMLSNEKDTNTAYKTFTERGDLWDNLKVIIRDAYEDEKKHKKWLEETIG